MSRVPMEMCAASLRLSLPNYRTCVLITSLLLTASRSLRGRSAERMLLPAAFLNAHH